MKCISLWQPWATLIVIGAKRIETRSWGTRYRGPLAIHAAKLWLSEFDALCNREPFNSALRAAGHSPRLGVPWRWVLPRGCVVAVTRLVACIRIADSAQVKHEEYGVTLPPNEPELSFGDYGVGRWAWVFDDVRAITPQKCRGQRGLFEIDDSLVPAPETPRGGQAPPPAGGWLSGWFSGAGGAQR